MINEMLLDGCWLQIIWWEFLLQRLRVCPHNQNGPQVMEWLFPHRETRSAPCGCIKAAEEYDVPQDVDEPEEAAGRCQSALCRWTAH